MGKQKKLSNKKLMSLATVELIQLIKEFRDGNEKALEKAKYPDILKKRGLKLGVSTDLIHRVFTGEFDNADGVEVSVKKVGS